MLKYVSDFRAFDKNIRESLKEKTISRIQEMSEAIMDESAKDIVADKLSTLERLKKVRIPSVEERKKKNQEKESKKDDVKESWYEGGAEFYESFDDENDEDLEESIADEVMKDAQSEEGMKKRKEKFALDEEWTPGEEENYPNLTDEEIADLIYSDEVISDEGDTVEDWEFTDSDLDTMIDEFGNVDLEDFPEDLEESEQLDEVSLEKVQKYSEKASKQYNDPNTPEDVKKKRIKGLVTAYKKASGKANVPSS